jgi:transcriptional regulator with XRE-family HTH domain
MTLGLKLYYLRTREKKVTQSTLARELSIRQATISNLEQDMSKPGLDLLVSLCRYFDVTPTWLLDDKTHFEPQLSDRWSNRRGLTTAGQYLEIEERALHPLQGSKFLVALLPGTLIYDESAARLRAQSGDEAALRELVDLDRQTREKAQVVLRKELEAERITKRLRRRGLSKGQAEKYF